MSYTKRYIDHLIEQEGEDYVNDVIFGAADDWEQEQEYWERERKVFLELLNEHPNLTDMNKNVPVFGENMDRTEELETLPF